MDQHIDHHFDNALESLKRQILLMGRTVEGMLEDCMKALKEQNDRMAKQIIERDYAVNALEVAIDEQCIELLARHQPAASDLRLITRGLKIVTDLERVGDLTVNTASRVIDIVKAASAPIDLDEMSKVVQQMLKDSIDAFIEMNVSKAEGVLINDDLVDDLTEKYIEQMLDSATKKPERIKVIFPMTSIVRYLERIADHATNIAELTIFTVKGRDVRHSRPK